MIEDCVYDCEARGRDCDHPDDPWDDDGPGFDFGDEPARRPVRTIRPAGGVL